MEVIHGCRMSRFWFALPCRCSNDWTYTKESIQAIPWTSINVIHLTPRVDWLRISIGTSPSFVCLRWHTRERTHTGTSDSTIEGHDILFRAQFSSWSFLRFEPKNERCRKAIFLTSSLLLFRCIRHGREAWSKGNTDIRQRSRSQVRSSINRSNWINSVPFHH